MHLKDVRNIVPAYAGKLLDDVSERTGYPLLVSQRSGIGYDSQVSMASGSQEVHELTFIPSYTEYLTHFVVNAAWKVLRMWAADPHERKVPATEPGRHLPNTEHRELQEKLPGLPARTVMEMSEFLYEGMVRQVTSMPLDIRVERELIERLPEHQREQRAYLQRQVSDLVPHFSPEIATVSPRHLYEATTSMNIVLAEEESLLTGKEVAPVFRQSRHYERGKRLDRILRCMNEPGHVGDRLVSDAWASELGVRDWYEWVRFS